MRRASRYAPIGNYRLLPEGCDAAGNTGHLCRALVPRFGVRGLAPVLGIGVGHYCPALVPGTSARFWGIQGQIGVEKPLQGKVCAPHISVIKAMSQPSYFLVVLTR